MIQDYQLVVKLVSHNRTFLHSSHVYRPHFLRPPHLSNILASRHGSNHNPTPITRGGTRKILSQKYANAGSVEMQEEMWLSSISLRSDLQTNSNEELRSESVVSFRSRKIQVSEICTLLVDDLEGLCFPALQSAEMFSFASISRPGCKDRLPQGPNIFSPHLQVLPAFIHDVIHDYFTDLKLTLAEVASKDPKGFIESWT